jgi:glycosyltransferase involved in cell wall biosynthesis
LNSPLVTIGVPVYRGQDDIPITLECLRTQSYPNLDVLISVDAADQETAKACEPFLTRDPRFRIHVQPSRLGWAGNTDWTMRNRRGEFYIFQQHDDQVSPSYVGDLVEAAARSPDAAICFAEMQCTGVQTQVLTGFALLGRPIERATAYLETLDPGPFRGLIRGSALASTSGLLLSDFDPLDSYGTEMRFLTELALLGEFRFVPGPIYYKRLHAANLLLTRNRWSAHQRLLAWGCLAAWMTEVIVPAGQTPDECRYLFDTVLARFVSPNDPWRWLKIPVRRLGRSRAKVLHPLRVLMERLKRDKLLGKFAGAHFSVYDANNSERRKALLRIVFDQLRNGGRLDPSACLQSTWDKVEDEVGRRFGIK